MSNWYVGREVVKRAVGVWGKGRDAVIDRVIEQASREIDALTDRRFIPITATRQYPWPQPFRVRSYELRLDEDLLSVDSLTDEGDDATAISSGDYFLEPVNTGPPYFWIEIDLSTTADFLAKNTHQRAVRVTGSWGYGNATVTAGTLRDSGGINTTVTTLVCSDGSLIDVGDTLLIGSEQLFVTERTSAAEENNDLLDGALTATRSEVSVTVDDGTRYNVGEVILVDSEKMYIETINGNVLTVERAYDASVSAAHSNNAAVSVFRTLTVTRGANGTTAATHSQADAITKYTPPPDITGLALALSLGYYSMGQGGWTGIVGSGPETIETRQAGLDKLRERVRREYRRHVVVGV